jgi:hypothetical protein
VKHSADTGSGVLGAGKGIRRRLKNKEKPVSLLIAIGG